MNYPDLKGAIETREGLAWPKRDVVSWDYLHEHADSPDKVMKHVENFGTIVQAGGHCGFYVRKYAERFHTVLTFEPEPVNFLCLTINCATKNVCAFRACLGAAPDMVSLMLKEDDSGSTFVDLRGEGLVPMVTVDSFSPRRCDLLALDLEGFELFALRGAERTIAQFRPVIVVEMYPPWMARFGVRDQDVYAFLHTYGYSMVEEDGSDRIFKVVKK